MLFTPLLSRYRVSNYKKYFQPLQQPGRKKPKFISTGRFPVPLSHSVPLSPNLYIDNKLLFSLDFLIEKYRFGTEGLGLAHFPNLLNYYARYNTFHYYYIPILLLLLKDSPLVPYRVIIVTKQALMVGLWLGLSQSHLVPQSQLWFLPINKITVSLYINNLTWYLPASIVALVPTTESEK